MGVTGKLWPGKHVVLPESPDKPPGAAHPQRPETVLLLHLGGVRDAPVAVHHPVDDDLPGRLGTQGGDGFLLHPVGHPDLGVVPADSIEHQRQLLQTGEFSAHPQLPVPASESILDDWTSVPHEHPPGGIGEHSVVPDRSQTLQEFEVVRDREVTGLRFPRRLEVSPDQLESLRAHQVRGLAGGFSGPCQFRAFPVRSHRGHVPNTHLTFGQLGGIAPSPCPNRPKSRHDLGRFSVPEASPSAVSRGAAWFRGVSHPRSS